MILSLFILSVCLLLSAVYSGSETGLYTLSRARVEVRARANRFGARLVQRVLESDSAILITILIGNNLTLEAATHEAEYFARSIGVPTPWLEVVITLTLTPLVVFFSELLPKDLFRKRPYTLLGLTSLFILISRWVLWPIERIMSLTSWVLERAMGVEPRGLVRLRGREAVLTLLAEGAREGALAPRSGELLTNVLKLRTTTVREVMLPWERVETVPDDLPLPELREQIGRSSHTRLPVIESSGGAFGYLHQLEILGLEPEGKIKQHDLLCLEPTVSVDRALARMRAAGHRCALVGHPEAPLGLLTLKDLLEEISGELAGW